MAEFCEEHRIDRGYVITRELSDFRTQAVPGARLATLLLNIPATLASYWFGRSEHEAANHDEA